MIAQRQNPAYPFPRFFFILTISINEYCLHHNKQVPFHQLPPEITVKIAEYLPSSDLFAFSRISVQVHDFIKIPLDRVRLLERINFPKLIDVFGGIKAIYQLPVLDLAPIYDRIAIDDPLLNLKPEDLSSPVMRGMINGSPFISFSLSYGKQKRFVTSIYLANRSTNTWDEIPADRCEIIMDRPFCKDSDPLVFDRLKRLLHHEPCGRHRTIDLKAVEETPGERGIALQ